MSMSRLLRCSGCSLLLAMGLVVAAAAPADAATMTWTSQRSGGTGNLVAVAAAADDSIVAVGHNTNVLKYDGSNWATWTQAQTPWNQAPDADNIAVLYSVAATGPSDIWIGSYDTPRGVSHWDGTAWSTVAMAGPNSDRVMQIWAHSADLVITGRSGGRITRFNGTTWTRTYNDSTAGAIQALDGTGAANIWAAGINGRVLRSTDGGVVWTAQTLPTALATQTWTSISALSDTAVWFTSDAGKIMFWDGSSFTEQASGVTTTLYSALALAADDVYAVGAGGTVLHFDGSAWSAVDLGISVTDTLRDIDVSPTGKLYIVGHNERIIVGQVSTIPEPATAGLLLLALTGLASRSRQHQA